MMCIPSYLATKLILSLQHHTVLLTRIGKLHQLKAVNTAAESDRNAVFE